MAKVTDEVSPVTVLPFASCSVTTGCVVQAVPPVQAAGVVVNANLLAGPAVTVTMGELAMFWREPPLCIVAVVKVFAPGAIGAVTRLPVLPYVTVKVPLAGQVILIGTVHGPAPEIVPSVAAVQVPAVTVVLVEVGAVHPDGTVIVA